MIMLVFFVYQHDKQSRIDRKVVVIINFDLILLEKFFDKKNNLIILAFIKLLRNIND